MPPPSKCGPEPTKEQQDAATPEDVFDKIDADGSGDIDEAEGIFALGCAVEWEWITEEDADEMFKYLATAAGDDEKLSKDEAKKAMDDLSSGSGSETSSDDG